MPGADFPVVGSGAVQGLLHDAWFGELVVAPLRLTAGNADAGKRALSASAEQLTGRRKIRSL